MDNDLEHLRLLSIFHYVVAGLAALFSLFPILHLTMGFMMATGRFGDSDEPAMRVFGWAFVFIAGAMITAGLTYAACMVVAGRSLAAHVRYTFCFVMAAISCAFIPFGTVLGVFTLLVLLRPAVKQLFGVGVSAAR